MVWKLTLGLQDYDSSEVATASGPERRVFNSLIIYDRNILTQGRGKEQLEQQIPMFPITFFVWY